LAFAVSGTALAAGVGRSPGKQALAARAQGQSFFWGNLIRNGESRPVTGLILIAITEQVTLCRYK